MPLRAGFHDVAPGMLAAIVTSLDMRVPPVRREDAPGSDGFSLQPLAERSIAYYRDLFRAVGADWLWTSRLVMPDTDLQAILDHPAVHIFELQTGHNGRGILELDFRVAGECELAFLGVTRALVGTGAGRFMMNRAIAMAFTQPIHRLWLHTCTLDHPGAVTFYERSGFRAYARQVELLPDPRLSGHLPRNAAPHIPVIE